jgi:hypothetical protein
MGNFNFHVCVPRDVHVAATKLCIYTSFCQKFIQCDVCDTIQEIFVTLAISVIVNKTIQNSVSNQSDGFSLMNSIWIPRILHVNN